MKALKLHLTINSLFSGISGLILILFPTLFTKLFQIENAIIPSIIGGGLIVFSIYVAFISSKFLHNVKLVNSISIMDILWVLASFTIVSFQLFEISFVGNVIITTIAIWILYLAITQIKHNKK